MEGRVYFGTLSGPDDEGDIVIRLGDDVARVAIENVADIELVSPPAEPIAAEPATIEGACRLTYNDGTTLQGDLLKVENGRASLRTGFSPAPVICPLAGLQMCEFTHLVDESQAPSGHVLEYAGLTIRGTLGASETTLGWRFVGAEAAVPFDLNEPLTIRRIESGEDGPEFADANSDIVLLKSGDLSPAALRASMRSSWRSQRTSVPRSGSRRMTCRPCRSVRS